MSEFEASYGDMLQSKKTGRKYEVIEWLNDDGGTEYMLKDILNDKVFMMTGDELTKPNPDKRKLLSIEDISKLKAKAVWEAAEALYCLNVSDGHGDEDEFAIKYFKSYANKLERGEL